MYKEKYEGRKKELDDIAYRIGLTVKDILEQREVRQEDEKDFVLSLVQAYVLPDQS